ncbi:hypothetical protein ACJMK2_010946 [Sinanodonta woodiana]|uniref:ADF-H domain-containing protein n=1 Tax=Sinanodonta woodiana TaxID=1069815 RepID=A0ABD3V3A3_SINWO
MAMSGISLDDNVLTKFTKMKITKKTDSDVQGAKSKCLMMKFDNTDKHVIEDLAQDWDKMDFDTLKSSLPDDDVRYFVYDLSYTTAGGVDNAKLILVMWCPESAKVKRKMLGSSTFENVKKKLDGVGVIIQANDLSDLDTDSIQKKLMKA